MREAVVSLLLDTNVCIDVLRGKRKVVECLSKCLPTDCFVSVVTEFELIQGAARAPKERREDEHRKVTRFLSVLQIVPFDSQCARIAGELNAELLNAGTPVSIADVFIAATGLRHDWTVVTSNVRDFARLKDLKLENWM